MAYVPPTTLVISGAGANAVLQLGTIWALDRYLRLTQNRSIYEHFSHFRGVSAGALICTLLCTDMTIHEITLVMHHGVSAFLQTNIQLLASWQRKGLGDMNGFRTVLESRLRGNTTFRSLFLRTGKDLGVGITNLHARRFQMMTHHTHPDASVVDAVMASISIPFIVEPVTVGGQVCLDGGVIVNFPYPSFYWIPTDKKECFGVALVASQPPSEPSKDNWKMCISLGTSLLNAQYEYSSKIIENNHPENVIKLYSIYNGISLSRCLKTQIQSSMVTQGVLFFFLKIAKTCPLLALTCFPKCLDAVVTLLAICVAFLSAKIEGSNLGE
jgi:predicted acylesterase/phospholipase RssA